MSKKSKKELENEVFADVDKNNLNDNLSHYQKQQIRKRLQYMSYDEVDKIFHCNSRKITPTKKKGMKAWNKGLKNDEYGAKFDYKNLANKISEQIKNENIKM